MAIPPRWLLVAAAATGLLAAMAPVVPVVEAQTVVKTRAHRVDHRTPADFREGVAQGLTLGDGDDVAIALESGAIRGTYTSPAVAAPFSSTSVGLHWTATAPETTTIDFAVRTSRDLASWSPWEEVLVEAARPDGWVVYGSLVPAEDGSRYVQYRADLRAGQGPGPVLRGVALFFLNSADPPRMQGLAVSLRPRSSALAVAKPAVVSRVAWGADETLRFAPGPEARPQEAWEREYVPVEKFVVHHTAGSNICVSREVYCQRRSVVEINDTYYYHAIANDWGDIGYNAIIGYDGRVYEGRHGRGKGVAEDGVVAGHALGYNRGTYGIALMGNFDEVPVPAPMYAALVDFLGWHFQSGVTGRAPPDPLGTSDYRKSDGTVHQGLPTILGHRDVNPTACPGAALYALLPKLRQDTRARLAWPPLHIELRALPEGDLATFEIVLRNHETYPLGHFAVRAALPRGATFLDTGAGSRPRGVFDGREVGWSDPDGTLPPLGWRGPYTFQVRMPEGTPREEAVVQAWASFRYPTPGTAVSEPVAAVPPRDVVVDATTPGGVAWRGEWPHSVSVADYYGASYQVHGPGDGSETFSWHLKIGEEAPYEVFAWWTAAPDRASNAPYTVHHAQGTETIRVDQRAGGGSWVSLGVFPFAPGLYRVDLSDDADGFIIADAVRTVRR